MVENDGRKHLLLALYESVNSFISIFEVKRKRQKSEFHANEMTLCLAIQKERKNNKPTIQ